MTTHIFCCNPLGDFKNAFANILWLEHFDVIGQAEQLRNHFVIPDRKSVV